MEPDDWGCAQKLLNAWPADLADFESSGTCLRLREALIGLGSGDAGWRDVAALVRQVLLESAATQARAIPLVVPVGAGMPTRDQWRVIHCSAVPHGDRLSISASAWHPPVRPEETPGASEDLRQVYRRAQPAVAQDCPADPFWEAALGHTRYVSLGQRQAARTVALAPPGSTTIISLPTGQGKTDVVLASILLTASRERSVSVIVVPTVVLALDMERRAREFVDAGQLPPSPSRHFAYTGSLAEDRKKEIRRDIKEGSQNLVFTSPEALVTGLSGALAEAAEAGYLKYLVIDEAHLVEQWGTEFRPEFQTMSAHRMAWMSKAPPGRQPATIAMSATLTDRQVQTLDELFGTPGRETALVWASALRKEPSYYVHQFASEVERTAAILEAVSLLPRPLALYATRKDDVHAWVRRLNEAGIRRVAQVSGDSDEEQRKAVVRGWRTDSENGGGSRTRLDVVVGTSAFGLGVDMPDVRTVLHACLPETVDRYYQEVGRGGRGGSASLSYLATAPSDFALAESMGRQTVISPEKGWDRWQRMYRGAEELGPGLLTVDLNVLPGHLMDESAQSQQWNVRTLNLMMRAGLITLRPPATPSQRDGESGDEWAGRLEEFFRHAGSRIGVQILDGETNSPEHWRATVSMERKKILKTQVAAFHHMLRVLDSSQCVGRTLAEVYGLAWNGGSLATVVNCRGCPNCRTRDHGSRMASDPFPAVHAWDSGQDPLSRMRGGAAVLRIQWKGNEEKRDLLPQLLERLVRRGMSVLGGPGLDTRLLSEVQDGALPAPVIVDHDADLSATYGNPVLWVLGDDPVLCGALTERISSPDLTYLVHPASLSIRDGSLLEKLSGGRPALSIRIALGEL